MQAQATGGDPCGSGAGQRSQAGLLAAPCSEAQAPVLTVLPLVTSAEAGGGPSSSPFNILDLKHIF